jgi:hypothetical protein
MKVRAQIHAPAVLTPGKDIPVPIGYETVAENKSNKHRKQTGIVLKLQLFMLLLICLFDILTTLYQLKNSWMTVL